ncbi:MAG: lipocalin-like domain-containing protein [Aliidiomarina sp.]|uniref:lipocalin-like domain-containing protein n=1 Tax=Aliidiomarina sp. TaxID=1872439 RepID=UPI0025BB3B4C|nr:lipocalin-like domain-containing protein [Aliidiomarina sp.]MCH8501194.1 lipocalin-like domain-containing protein [Aliidiomarina sp.]
MIKQGQVEGGWELVSWEIHYDESKVAYPFGTDPKGILVYTSDGFMSAQLSVSSRPSLQGQSIRKLTDAQRQSLLEGFFAYCGAYTVIENSIVHHVSQALNPDFIGTDQVRRAELNDNTLVLSGRETDASGQARDHILKWRRAKRSKT